MVKELREQITKLQLQIKVIQDECSHPSLCVTKKHFSDTSNWVRNEDSYWTEFHCSLCDKHWQEDGSK
jgi:hypothetical protein